MKSTQLLCLLYISFCFNCVNPKKENNVVVKERPSQYITVLGVAQDAGFPQINCEKECCEPFYLGKVPKKLVSCLGLVDLKARKKWIFDATPDISEQLQILKSKHLDNESIVDGVFLTHAHTGHYTGLMEFGREAMSASNIPVYVMPKMKSFIENNQPWRQLTVLNNIKLNIIKEDSAVVLNSNLKVTPVVVPHRDELSETVGFKIEGNNKTVLFIPDINKWTIWNKNIVEEVKKVDYAFIDATFFKNGEINRPINEVPHPFIEETITLFKNELVKTKSKIYFIHLNHTNPALRDKHVLKHSVEKLGFNFAKEGAVFAL